MALHREDMDEESYGFSDLPIEDENSEDLDHKKRIRKMLEERLERKRLKEEIDELDGDFDWDELDK